MLRELFKDHLANGVLATEKVRSFTGIWVAEHVNDIRF